MCQWWIGIYAHCPSINSSFVLGGNEWKEFVLPQGMVRVICKAEEILQEFIKYLSYSQMLDWTNRMRTRRAFPLRICYKNPKLMQPNPTWTSLLSLVHIYIRILARDERARHCHSCPCVEKSAWECFFSLLMNVQDMLHWSATEDGDVIFRPGLSRPRGCIVPPRCHI